jgi:hypothetical protein
LSSIDDTRDAIRSRLLYDEWRAEHGETRFGAMTRLSRSVILTPPLREAFLLKHVEELTYNRLGIGSEPRDPESPAWR